MGCISHIGINTPSSITGTRGFTSSKLLQTAVCFPNWHVVKLFKRKEERAGEEVESWFETWDRALWKCKRIQNDFKVVCARLRTEVKQEMEGERETGREGERERGREPSRFAKSI